jgi:hypothetical protein
MCMHDVTSSASDHHVRVFKMRRWARDRILVHSLPDFVNLVIVFTLLLW